MFLFSTNASEAVEIGSVDEKKGWATPEELEASSAW